jgi:rhodanese-related sulfurtransferase
MKNMNIQKNIINHTPSEAYHFLQENPNAVLIDVRTKEEHQFVGIPDVANLALIPVKTLPQFSVNEDFVEQVITYLTQQSNDNNQNNPNNQEISIVVLKTPLLMLCRSGVRSLFAGELLLQHGFTEVYNIQYGFEGDLDDTKHRSTKNGWKFEQLPWKQN